jgi:flavin reductase (DIM6/NTAB) family NADH-FMN oxidoreductase RutF
MERPIERSVRIQPKILYIGTPVVLVTSENVDGTANISPMSSAWGFADRFVLGMGGTGKGLENVTRTRECVLNVPSPELWQRVERLAPTTGQEDVPAFKREIGYRFVKDKFAEAPFTPLPSEVVRAPRIAECPLQFEVRVRRIEHSELDAERFGYPSLAIVEVEVVRAHAHESIVDPANGHVDVSRYSPLLYVFRHYLPTGKELGHTFKA